MCALAAGLAISPAQAQAQACPPKTPVAESRLRDYRPVFRQCRNDAGETRLAIRQMSLDGEPAILTVNAATLATSLEREGCWRCVDTDDEAQKDTRFLRALRPTSGPDEPKLYAAGRSVSSNAGLGHGAGDGSFVTGDLCPSRRPLDRGFFRRLAQTAPGAPVALAVSGLWLKIITPISTG